MKEMLWDALLTASNVLRWFEKYDVSNALVLFSRLARKKELEDVDMLEKFVEQVERGEGEEMFGRLELAEESSEEWERLYGETRAENARLAAQLLQDAPLAAAARALRPEVLAFALLMEKKLRANDHKGGWQRDTAESLLERLREETEEIAALGGHLMGAQIRHQERPLDPTHKSGTADRIGDECADVANFAMMIADICGALKASVVAQAEAREQAKGDG